MDNVQRDPGRVFVVGLGPGSPDHLTLGAAAKLKSARQVILRTKVHPVVEWLDSEGIRYTSCDDLYETAEDFDEVYVGIAERVLAAAAGGEAVYAVPGHPLMGERSVAIIIEQGRAQGYSVDIVQGVSFVDAVAASVEFDPVNGAAILDALSFTPSKIDRASYNLFTQVYSRLVASDLKLALMDIFPADHPVVVVRAAGVPGEERVQRVPLHELDRLNWIDHLTSVVVLPLTGEAAGESNEDRPAPNVTRSTEGRSTPGSAGQCNAAPDGGPGGQPGCRFPADRLVDIMAALRAETGCPWDREQTHESLKPYLIEEAYEFLEAVDQRDPEKMCEELGDVLLQVVFHAQLAWECGLFDFNDVVRTISDKLVRRHPHVFGDVEVEGASAVLRNWEQIKQQERKAARKGDEPVSVLEGVPRHLPALLRAYRVQSKASRVGFDWGSAGEAASKISEEAQEFLQALQSGVLDAQGKAQEEFGDLLFSIVNVARLLGLEPETALTMAVDKFIRRFKAVEAKAAAQGRSLREMTLKEMDRLWDDVKREER